MAQSHVQQGWWTWLQSYAGDVEPSQTREDTKSSIVDGVPTNRASSSSPYGPYVRTGRGGAGNFQWQNENKSHAQDVEAQKAPTLSETQRLAASIEHADTQSAIQNLQTQNAGTRYIRVGRGLVHGDQVPTSTTASAISPSSASKPVMYTGRGGAGNMAAAASANQQNEAAKLGKEQQEAERQRRKAENQVENILSPPSQAWLGGKQKNAKPEEVELEEWDKNVTNGIS